jgi:hypothetical protein
MCRVATAGKRRRRQDHDLIGLALALECTARSCLPPTISPAMVVYVAVYAERVRRTNIYLSDRQQAGLDARAAAEGSTRSDIIRALVDRELNLVEEADLDEVLGDLAGDLAQRARELSEDDPDLRID